MLEFLRNMVEELTSLLTVVDLVFFGVVTFIVGWRYSFLYHAFAVFMFSCVVYGVARHLGASPEVAHYILWVVWGLAFIGAVSRAGGGGGDD